jgi:hypothetical protein
MTRVFPLPQNHGIWALTDKRQGEEQQVTPNRGYGMSIDDATRQLKISRNSGSDQRLRSSRSDLAIPGATERSAGSESTMTKTTPEALWK